jgi:predicted nuclease with TOPRIM domain
MNAIVAAVKELYFSEQIIDPVIIRTLAKHKSNGKRLRKELLRIRSVGMSDILRKTIIFALQSQNEEHADEIAKLVSANDTIVLGLRGVNVQYDNKDLLEESNRVLTKYKEEHTKEKEQLTLQYTALNAIANGLRDQNTYLSEENAKRIKEKEQLTSQYTALNATANGLRDQNTYLLEENARISQLRDSSFSEEQISALTNENTRLNAKLTTLEEIINELQTQNSDLAEKLRLYNTSVSLTSANAFPLEIVPSYD